MQKCVTESEFPVTPPLLLTVPWDTGSPCALTSRLSVRNWDRATFALMTPKQQVEKASGPETDSSTSAPISHLPERSPKNNRKCTCPPWRPRLASGVRPRQREGRPGQEQLCTGAPEENPRPAGHRERDHAGSLRSPRCLKCATDQVKTRTPPSLPAGEIT